MSPDCNWCVHIEAGIFSLEQHKMHVAVKNGKNYTCLPLLRPECGGFTKSEKRIGWWSVAYTKREGHLEVTQVNDTGYSIRKVHCENCGK